MNRIPYFTLCSAYSTCRVLLLFVLFTLTSHLSHSHLPSRKVGS